MYKISLTENDFKSTELHIMKDAVILCEKTLYNLKNIYLKNNSETAEDYHQEVLNIYKELLNIYKPILNELKTLSINLNTTGMNELDVEIFFEDYFKDVNSKMKKVISIVYPKYKKYFNKDISDKLSDINTYISKQKLSYLSFEERDLTDDFTSLKEKIVVKKSDFSLGWFLVWLIIFFPYAFYYLLTSILKNKTT